MMGKKQTDNSKKACPWCHEAKLVCHGNNVQGKQNYLCRGCGRQTVKPVVILTDEDFDNAFFFPDGTPLSLKGKTLAGFLKEVFSQRGIRVDRDTISPKMSKVSK